MARTNSEKVDEVIKEVATLNEWLNHAREEIKRLDSHFREEIKRLDEAREKFGTRLWGLVVLVIVALLGLVANLVVLLQRR